jgi:hypothetical protein
MTGSKDVRPIYLFSLPRSGSTLVQRVLSSHPEISTAPEPWLLLPQIYLLRDGGHGAEYGGPQAARAIGEFISRLPGGEHSYDAALRRFILELYAAAGQGRETNGGPAAPPTYFLDKTPRYHFIAEELFRLFPEARFIFLWRNPLSIVASVVDTWTNGTWRLGRWRRDLFDGLDSLVSSYRAHGESSVAVRYEDLVSRPLDSWPSIFRYLDLPFDQSVLTRFASVRLDARMGDRSGPARYRALSTEPVGKWMRTIANPLRKRWCRRYLEWIGEDRLAVMGYRLDELLRELDGVPATTRELGPDLAWMVLARAFQFVPARHGSRMAWKDKR